jgi:hypothetical protein
MYDGPSIGAQSTVARPQFPLAKCARLSLGSRHWLGNGFRHGRVRGGPVALEVLLEVTAGFVQLVLVQAQVKHFRWTLSEFFRRHHLHVNVAALRFATGLDETLENLQARKFFSNKFQ